VAYRNEEADETAVYQTFPNLEMVRVSFVLTRTTVRVVITVYEPAIGTKT
jgi:hypothetical protein